MWAKDVKIMFEVRKNIAESLKITAEKFAFGETTCARPIASKLAWRSLNRGLGGFNIFDTSFLPIHYIIYNGGGGCAAEVGKARLRPLNGARTRFSHVIINECITRY